MSRAASHAAEKFLCPIRASAVEAIGFLDPLGFAILEALRGVFPCNG
jgi:hypothetical protein